jgi:hypothetical protein
MGNPMLIEVKGLGDRASAMLPCTRPEGSAMEQISSQPFALVALVGSA